MTNTKQEFTVEEFVKAWQTSETVKEVKQKLELDEKNKRVSYLAGFLRAHKVPLKKLMTGSKYDYPNLIKLAQQYVSYGRTVVIKGVKNGTN